MNTDIQHTQMVLGAAMTIAALGTFFLSLASRWIGGVWATLLAVTVALLLSYQPLINAPLLPVGTDLLRRILVAVIPFALAVLLLSFKKVPWWARLIFAIVGPAGLLLLIFSHFEPSIARQDFFLYKIGPVALSIFIAWLLVEPLASRSPGAAAPIVIGPVTGGLAFLLMLSAESNAGQLAPIIPATALGALLAAVVAFLIGKPISFARGPILLWLTLISALFAFMWFDTDDMPLRYLYWIATAPLLAWIPELGPIKKLKPWKRESLRLLLVAIPVLVAVTLAFRQHREDAKAAGDEFGCIFNQSAAPILPSQIPMPNTINPPTMT